MTIDQILVALALGLVVSEISDVCPCAARKLVRWSAYRRYVPPSRAELRAEELAALIDVQPGRLLKLITALGFAAAAVMTRKVAAPRVAPPVPLWQPTTLTVPVHYEDCETAMSPNTVRNHPRARAVDQAFCRLTDEVRRATKEIGLNSRSWRGCIRKLRRITGDHRWTLVATNIDLLEKINCSSWNSAERKTSMPYYSVYYVIYYNSVLADSTVTQYQAATETTRAEIHRLTRDFLLSSAPRRP